MAEEISGWDLLKLYTLNVRKTQIGTIKVSSILPNPRKTDDATPDLRERPYGGQCMSVARALATRPMKNVIMQKTRDITM